MNWSILKHNNTKNICLKYVLLFINIKRCTFNKIKMLTIWTTVLFATPCWEKYQLRVSMTDNMFATFDSAPHSINYTFLLLFYKYVFYSTSRAELVSRQIIVPWAIWVIENTICYRNFYTNIYLKKQ